MISETRRYYYISRINRKLSIEHAQLENMTGETLLYRLFNSHRKK